MAVRVCGSRKSACAYVHSGAPGGNVSNKCVARLERLLGIIWGITPRRTNAPVEQGHHRNCLTYAPTGGVSCNAGGAPGDSLGYKTLHAAAREDGVRSGLCQQHP